MLEKLSPSPDMRPNIGPKVAERLSILTQLWRSYPVPRMTASYVFSVRVPRSVWRSESVIWSVRQEHGDEAEVARTAW